MIWSGYGQRATVLVLAAILVRCERHSQDQKTVPHDSYPDAKTFEESIKRYPYVASTARVARITKGTKELQRCMTKQEISALLGPPDASQTDYGPKGPNAWWLGSNWVFYVSKRSDMVNLEDPRVEIFFDTKDRATWIVPTGIVGAREIGFVNVGCA